MKRTMIFSSRNYIMIPRVPHSAHKHLGEDTSHYIQRNRSGIPTPLAVPQRLPLLPMPFLELSANSVNILPQCVLRLLEPRINTLHSSPSSAFCSASCLSCLSLSCSPSSPPALHTTQFSGISSSSTPFGALLIWQGLIACPQVRYIIFLRQFGQF